MDFVRSIKKYITNDDTCNSNKCRGLRYLFTKYYIFDKKIVIYVISPVNTFLQYG